MKLPTNRTLVNVLGIVILLAVVLPFAITAVPQGVGADQSYTVTSGSMEPAISPGDVVIVRDVPAEDIEEGDVVTYELGTGTGSVERRTHRVVEVAERDDGRYFQTKGDANDAPDRELVPADAVVGRVMLTVPYIGYVTTFANTRLGVVVLVIAPVTLLVVSEVWSLARAVRTSRAADSSPNAESSRNGPAGPASGDGAGGDER